MHAISKVPAACLLVTILLLVHAAPSFSREQNRDTSQRTTQLKQLAAVRGEIVKITTPSKGTLLIAVKPAKDFQEVTVLARENDLVGTAVARPGDSDLLGLLSGDARDDETITAAELSEGDIVSVIYDPALQNRVLEIYLH